MIIDEIVAAFADCEGWWNPDPTVIPRAANNPMDLVFAFQNGATPKQFGTNMRKFATWPHPQGGIVAAYRQVYAWTSLGLSLSSMIAEQDPGNLDYQSRMKALLPHVDFYVSVLSLIPDLIRPAWNA